MTREGQIAYWRSNLVTIAVVLACWVVTALVAPFVLADHLDGVRIGGIPLGFWFGHQGAPVIFALLVAAYVLRMNRLDRAHGVYER